jgi:hypothetical protein
MRCRIHSTGPAGRRRSPLTRVAHRRPLPARGDRLPMPLVSSRRSLQSLRRPHSRPATSPAREGGSSGRSELRDWERSSGEAGEESRSGVPLPPVRQFPEVPNPGLPWSLPTNTVRTMECPANRPSWGFRPSPERVMRIVGRVHHRSSAARTEATAAGGQSESDGSTGSIPSRSRRCRCRSSSVRM